MFCFADIVITSWTKGIEIFDVVVGRTYNNNYYNEHAELELSNLVQNDAIIWNCPQIVISHTQGRRNSQKWHMTTNEISVLWRCILSSNHMMLKHSTNATAFVNTLDHDVICVKSLIKFYSWLLWLGFVASVHATECGLTCSCLYLIIEGKCWSWNVMCSILCICNRVDHVQGKLSYKHDAVTWITDYLQVTRIFWNKGLQISSRN